MSDRVLEETAARRSGEPADESVRVSQTDLVAALCNKLGATQVGYVVDRNKSTISRWRSGAVEAGEASLRPLRVCFQIFRMLESVDADETIRAWFMGHNPQLDDSSPLEAIRGGKNREVLAAARAFASGG